MPVPLRDILASRALARRGAPGRTLTLVLATVLPVVVAVAATVVLVAWRLRVRRAATRPSPSQPREQPRLEVKTKVSMKSVNSAATTSSATHFSTLPPYSPNSPASEPETLTAIPGPRPPRPDRPPPLPPRGKERDVEHDGIVGYPGDEDSDDASSTSSFGSLAPFDFELPFTLTHRSLSPVPEERESMSMTTRNSSYSVRITPRTSMCEDGANVSDTLAQQYRQHIQMGRLSISPPPPPPPALMPQPPPPASTSKNAGPFFSSRP